MISGTPGHPELYAPPGSRLARALKIFTGTDFSAYEDGRINFDDGIYCLLRSCETLPLDRITAEMHKNTLTYSACSAARSR